jgi:glc operon protein GlcG
MNTLLKMVTPLTLLVAHVATAATQPALTLTDAQRVMTGALNYARSHNAPGAAVAIVDEGGSIVLLQRLDNTFPSAPNISIGKARTAAGFHKATRDLEKIVNGGRVTMTALPAVTTFTPLQGGVPLMTGNAYVGAVGVSGGASAQQDDEIAQAGADAFVTAPTADAKSTSFIPAKEVKLALSRNGSLLSTPEYKVNASRRDSAGQAEIHLQDTDIFYILSGSANLVTGGEVIDAKTTEPNEIRGTRIEGGTTQEIRPGDVISIARGVPHWFRTVNSPLEYYVVKTTAQGT